MVHGYEPHIPERCAMWTRARRERTRVITTATMGPGAVPILTPRHECHADVMHAQAHANITEQASAGTAPQNTALHARGRTELHLGYRGYIRSTQLLRTAQRSRGGLVAASKTIRFTDATSVAMPNALSSSYAATLSNGCSASLEHCAFTPITPCKQPPRTAPHTSTPHHSTVQYSSAPRSVTS